MKEAIESKLVELEAQLHAERFGKAKADEDHYDVGFRKATIRRIESEIIFLRNLLRMS